MRTGHLLTLLPAPEGVPRASLSPTTAVARCCWGTGLFEVHGFWMMLELHMYGVYI